MSCVFNWGSLVLLHCLWEKFHLQTRRSSQNVPRCCFLRLLDSGFIFLRLSPVTLVEEESVPVSQTSARESPIDEQ